MSGLEVIGGISAVIGIIDTPVKVYRSVQNDVRANRIRGIFEKTIPEESDTREKRYRKVVQRFGKGNGIEEPMTDLTQDVQLLVNHHGVRPVRPEQNAETAHILEELKSLKSSEDSFPMFF